MSWSILLSALIHHGEAVDPALLEWIKDTLDHLIGLGPWTVIIGIGLLVLLMPLSLVVFYLVQSRRGGNGAGQITS